MTAYKGLIILIGMFGLLVVPMTDILINYFKRKKNDSTRNNK